MAGLSLSLSQQQRQMMILAPQLRQSLEMLQLPVLELKAVIQKELEQNPTIEDVTDPAEVSLEAAQLKEEASNAADEAAAENFDAELAAIEKLDDEWRDYFLQGMENASSLEDQEERRQYMFDSLRQPVSLQDHLLEQLPLANLTAPQMRIAEMIIGHIDDDGYFRSDLENLAFQADSPVAELTRILRTIQEFHPPGVGARSLQECLQLQLPTLPASPARDLATLILNDHFDTLGAGQHRVLQRQLSVTSGDLEAALTLIRSLNPRPGSAFDLTATEYVEPEVFVQKVDGRYVVQVNDDFLPHIRISSHYRRLLHDSTVTSEVKSYIRERIRAGVFLIKSIHQRQRTILQIASEIVAMQQEFFEKGVAHLRPMTMSDVAEKVGVHETTVSRTVANKYMRSPRGVHELKYFFSPGLKTSTGASISNRTVQDKIAQMIAAEDRADPLSDQAIQEALATAGIQVARRTVAKYRTILKILPSHRRRQN